MSGSTHQFRLPDILAEWPYPRSLNPHYSEVMPVAVAWLESFEALDARTQRAVKKADPTLVAALAYPFASQEQLRTACDLMNLFIVFDEYSDVENEHGVRELGDIVMDALRNPDKVRPLGESVVGEIARQYWKLAIWTASPSSQRRFIDYFDRYITSVVEEAEDRTHHRIRDIESYFSVRRGTVGAKPSSALLQLDMDLPDEVVNHPNIQGVLNCAIDMVILVNDIYSYNVKQARGDDAHNIVTIVMHQLNMDIHGAMDWIASYSQEVETAFRTNKAGIPTWGDVIDAQVARYIYGIGNCVRAIDTWSFESGRYFGKNGKEVQDSRMVQLLPAVR